MASLIRVLNNATAEYEARYAKPVVSLVTDRADTIQAIVDALLPFSFRFGNMDVFNDGGSSGQKVGFRLPDQNISFQFGGEFCTFVKQGANWATAEHTLTVLEAAEGALLSRKEMEITSRAVTLGMHLQLLDTPVQEVLGRFLPAPFSPYLTGDDEEYNTKRHAVLVHWTNGGVLLDTSDAVANGIFARLTSEVVGGTIRQLFEKLLRDQMHVFGVLQVNEATDDD